MDLEDAGIFIELMQMHECIWNNQSKYYKNNVLKMRVWRSISKDTGKTVEECKRFRKTLRCRFYKEKTYWDGKSGCKANFKEEWPYYQKMLFLKDSVTPRGTYSNLKKRSPLDRDEFELHDEQEVYDEQERYGDQEFYYDQSHYNDQGRYDEQELENCIEEVYERKYEYSGPEENESLDENSNLKLHRQENDLFKSLNEHLNNNEETLVDDAFPDSEERKDSCNVNSLELMAIPTNSMTSTAKRPKEAPQIVNDVQISPPNAISVESINPAENVNIKSIITTAPRLPVKFLLTPKQTTNVVNINEKIAAKKINIPATSTSCFKKPVNNTKHESIVVDISIPLEKKLKSAVNSTQLTQYSQWI